MSEEHAIEVPGARFTVIARPTVKQQLRFRMASTFSDPADFLVAGWNGLRKMLVAWDSELLPEPDVDLDEVDDSRIADLIQAAVLESREYYASLSREKNSPPPSSDS